MENKLLAFQKKIGTIKKDSKNPHFKNTYASLSQILSEVKPILSELGLVLLQPITDNKVCTWINEGDKTIAGSGIELPVGLTPQQLGSAITYFRRYTLASLLALEIDDDDGTVASTHIKVAEPVKQQPYLAENSPEFEKAQKYIADGGSIDDIKKKYFVSESVAKLLIP